MLKSEPSTKKNVGILISRPPIFTAIPLSLPSLFPLNVSSLLLSHLLHCLLVFLVQFLQFPQHFQLIFLTQVQNELNICLFNVRQHCFVFANVFNLRYIR
uniref:Uncharacterized protein n=1 Tax=Cacopsylla melanoneura TaxID=428564 RepID=A0A8D8TIX1_9HEMI